MCHFEMASQRHPCIECLKAEVTVVLWTVQMLGLNVISEINNMFGAVASLTNGAPSKLPPIFVDCLDHGLDKRHNI